MGFISLGCPKNLVDSEVMMGLLDRAGARLTARPEDAEILGVNTCSFIDTAKQESVDTILEMARLKTSGWNREEAHRRRLPRRALPRRDHEVHPRSRRRSRHRRELESILAAAGPFRMAVAAATISPVNIHTGSHAAAVRSGKESQSGTHKHYEHLAKSGAALDSLEERVEGYTTSVVPKKLQAGALALPAVSRSVQA